MYFLIHPWGWINDKRMAVHWLKLRMSWFVQPNSFRFEAVYGHSLIINTSLGMYQEIHPYRASSIDSVKINTSLPMMRECQIHPSSWHGRYSIILLPKKPSNAGVSVLLKGDSEKKYRDLDTFSG